MLHACLCKNRFTFFLQMCLHLVYTWAYIELNVLHVLFRKFYLKTSSIHIQQKKQIFGIMLGTREYAFLVTVY